MTEGVVTTKKRDAMIARMAALGVRESELVERFVLGTGKGGQKLNKTSSCVYLRHIPSGIEVKCQRARSRDLNRYLARKELCDRLDEIRNGRASERQQAMEKVRRQKRRRSRRQRDRMLDDKRKHGTVKAQRRKVSDDS